MATHNLSPSLGLAIPTYNRSPFLKELLISIRKSTVKPNHILISDNASTDSTKDVCASFTDLPLQYVRQSQNMGMDSNILFCYANACGDYIWVIGDDDLIEPHTISFLLEHLSMQSEEGVMYLRNRHIHLDGMPLYEPSIFPQTIGFEHFPSLSALSILRSGWAIISGIIVNSNLYRSKLRSVDSGYLKGTAMQFLPALASCLRTTGAALSRFYGYRYRCANQWQGVTVESVCIDATIRLLRQEPWMLRECRQDVHEWCDELLRCHVRPLLVRGQYRLSLGDRLRLLSKVSRGFPRTPYALTKFTAHALLGL